MWLNDEELRVGKIKGIICMLLRRESVLHFMG